MRFLTQEEVCQRTTMSYWTIMRMVKRGEFPKPRSISPNRTGWIESEVNDWIAERPAINLGEGTNGSKKIGRKANAV